jgi:hypothetical protein
MTDKRRRRARVEGVHRSTMGVQVPLVEMDGGPAVEMEMERANGEQRGCVAPRWWPSTSCPLPGDRATGSPPLHFPGQIKQLFLPDQFVEFEMQPVSPSCSSLQN